MRERRFRDLSQTGGWGGEFCAAFSGGVATETAGRGRSEGIGRNHRLPAIIPKWSSLSVTKLWEFLRLYCDKHYYLHRYLREGFFPEIVLKQMAEHDRETVKKLRWKRAWKKNEKKCLQNSIGDLVLNLEYLYIESSRDGHIYSFVEWNLLFQMSYDSKRLQ